MCKIDNFVMSSALALTSSFVATTACGGGGASRPRPLAHHYDDMHIAAVSIDEKQAVVQAQQAYSVAKLKHAEVKTNYDDADTKLAVAKNELKQAILAEQSAKTEKAAADSSADMTRVNQATARMRTAQLHRKASDEKVGYIKSQRAYLSQFLRYHEEDMYAKEAAYEWEKAKVGQSKDIQPKGVNYATYEAQAKSRAESAQRALAKSQNVKAKMESQKRKWLDLKSSAERASSDNSSGSL